MVSHSLGINHAFQVIGGGCSSDHMAMAQPWFKGRLGGSHTQQLEASGSAGMGRDG